MLFSSWLRNRHANRNSPRSAAPRFRPAVEALEDRLVPSTLWVTNNLDVDAANPGVLIPGSLRYEIAAAQPGDTIQIYGASGETIQLTTYYGQSNPLVIDKDLDIEGPGSDLCAVSGGNASQVFQVAAGAHVTLAGLTIERGWSGSSADCGAVLNAGNLTLYGCVLAGNNAAGSGGAVYNKGTLAVNHCTVTGNWASDGGGIYNAGTLTLSATSVSQNTASNDGGGIYNAGQLSVVNKSAITHNTAPAGADLYEAPDGWYTQDKPSKIGKIG